MLMIVEKNIYKKKERKTPEVRTCTFEKKTHLTKSSWKILETNFDSRVRLMLVPHANSLGFL